MYAIYIRYTNEHNELQEQANTGIITNRTKQNRNNTKTNRNKTKNKSK